MSHNNVYPLRIADALKADRHVFVRDLVLEAHIGVHTHERGTTQPVRFNIDLTVAETGERPEDRLSAVVCYEQVVRRIEEIVAAGHLNLVETLAERIAAVCLEDQRVKAARVRIEKLAAIANAASVGVEIERVRAGDE